MPSGQSVLLVETDPGVINDVRCALELIAIKVTAVPSLDAARESAQQSRPDAIVTRGSVAGDEAVALRLLNEIGNDQIWSGVPLVLLCSREEERVFGEKTTLFDGVLHLPVEFPTFSQKSKALLSELALARQDASSLPDMGGVKLAPNVTQNRTKTNAVPPPGNHDIDAASLTVYQIQIAVLDALRKDPAFTRATPHDVARLLLEKTKEICAVYSTPKR